MDRPTDKEIKKVKLWECSRVGHDYTVVSLRGDYNEIKAQVHCNHCLTNWEMTEIK